MEGYLGRRSPQGAMLPSTPGAWLRVTSQSDPPSDLLPTGGTAQSGERQQRAVRAPQAAHHSHAHSRHGSTVPPHLSGLHQPGGGLHPPSTTSFLPAIPPPLQTLLSVFSFPPPCPPFPSPPTLRGAQGLPQPRFPRCPHRSGTHRGAPPPDVGLGGGGGRGAERGNTGATRGKVWSSPGAVLAGGHRVDSSEPYRGGVRFPSMLQSGAAAPLLPRPHRSEWSGLGLPRLPPLRPAPPAPLPPRPLPFSAAPQPAAAPHPPPAPLPLSLGAVRGSAGCPLPPRTPSPATAPASPVPCHRLQHLQHEHGPVRPSSSFVCSEQGTARCR